MFDFNHRNLISALGALCISCQAIAADINLPFEKYTLDNGLRLIVHEDHKAPIVAVSVWYNVGSKDEPQGLTGFAHLFEHLMFNGSENYNDEYFKPFHQVGATDMNGTTWFDRTNYFQTVPTPALDLALWMESDRMGHLLGVLTQENLDTQRGVVQNEKRQSDNRPYRKSEYRILEGVFPAAHPYRHSTIGSMDDLNAASLEDVQNWFKTYYGPNNAVLVIAGDVTPEKALELTNKYFGDIPAGPELHQMQQWVPTRDHKVTERMYDQVPQARIYKVWAVPGRTTQAAHELAIAAQLLGQGKTSQLYQSLITEKKLASQVTAYVEDHSLSSLFQIEVTVNPGVDPQTVSQAIDDEVARFLAKKASTKDLKRVKMGVNASVIRGLEKVGGSSGKAAALAEGELYANDANFIETSIKWYRDASAKAIQKTTQQWLAKGEYELTVLPFPHYSNTASNIDRSAGLPAVGEMPSLSVPTIENAVLSNGLKVKVAHSGAVPVINMALQFNAGYAADSTGLKLGTSSFALAMLDEGTRNMSALEISETAELLGAQISTSSNLDTSIVSLSALKSELDDSLELYADILKNPSFDARELERLRGQWLAGISQEKASPVHLALRTLPQLLFGQGHAYGIPHTGSGTEQSIQSLQREDLVNFYQQWIRPDNGELLIVGDTHLQEIMPLLEKYLGNWQVDGKKPPVIEKPMPTMTQHKVVVIDKPGAPQSLILAGRLADIDVSNDVEAQTMNAILGGDFTARVNMNLREDKHWAYGAFTLVRNAQGPGMFLVYAPVQSDKTAASITELRQEISAFTGTKPATPEELANTIQNKVNELPGAFETGGDVLSSMLGNARFGRPDNHVSTLTARYEHITLTDIEKTAQHIIGDGALVWLIVGDKTTVVPQLHDIGLNDITFMTMDGAVISDN